MSTPDASQSSGGVADGPSEPAKLTDGAGRSILPTATLPGVDFGAHLDERDHAKVDSVTLPSQQTQCSSVPTPAAERDDSRARSYGAGVPGNIQEARRHDARLERAQTAPLSRPRPVSRRSTLLQALRPHPSPYSYQFASMSSDTESSSDDEIHGGSVRPARRTVSRAHSSAEKKEEKQKKQEAREGHSFSRFHFGNEYFRTKGNVSKRDGRLNISVNETANNGYLARVLGPSMKQHLERRQPRPGANHGKSRDAADTESLVSALHATAARPRLNIVIIIIGSRGDIQPFLKIGRILKHEHGHRVRIATHPTFRDFVGQESGLEFFSIGGNPSELMAFMVKNPGLIPSLSTIKEGEVPRRRKAMGEMFEGMYRACTNSTDDEGDVLNLKLMGDKSPFIADAIIANPPSMAHVHIAERLGIPLHIMFTFPYSPTQAFPHPLANIKRGKSNVDANYLNFMSYSLVELMTWQGLGDIVNRFRVKTLGLEPVSSLWAPGALYRMKVPYTYMWSPSLVPKPGDWGPEIDLSGFVFLEMASSFKPPQDLLDFLGAGEPPVYIGFGSIVVDDPNRFTDMIFEATRLAGVRALVNKGWGGLGKSNADTPDNIFMLENTPHDWLFPRVKAVVHHGGAGTAAIGLKCAKPTMIVPFFGDQAFWAARVTEAKAGAQEVIHWKQLTAEKLAEGIKQCLTEEAQVNVQKLAEGIAAEGDGAANAVASFHNALPLAGARTMRCSILEDRVAVWRIKGSAVRLSALAAEILMEWGKINGSDLKLLHKVQWNDFDGPGEPITGVAGAVTDSLYDIGTGLGMVPVRMAKHLKKRVEHEHKKAMAKKRKEERQQAKLGSAETGAKENSEQATTLRRPSNTRIETSNTIASVLSADPSDPLVKELALDFHYGMKQSGWAVLTMPNDLHLAIARGLHNSPRLWGDATVRTPIRITGIKTGFDAARNEFVYGIYDAWTGLVTQPIGGFHDGDTVPAKLRGLGSGLGKGVGGFVLKNLSAIVSPPAMAGKGFFVSLKKRSTPDGPGSNAGIRRAHLVQGRRELDALRAQEADGDGTQEELSRVEEQVRAGWKVYEEIWQTAREQYAPVGGDLVHRCKLHKEKRRWQKAGALENIHTAHRALQHAKRGDDLGEHFARRRSEMLQAEQPHMSGMEMRAKGGEGKEADGEEGEEGEDGEDGEDDDDDGRRLGRGRGDSDETEDAKEDAKEDVKDDVKGKEQKLRVPEDAHPLEASTVVGIPEEEQQEQQHRKKGSSVWKRGWKPLSTVIPTSPPAMTGGNGMATV